MTPPIKGRPVCQNEGCGKLSIMCSCETPRFPDLPAPWLDELQPMPGWAYDEGDTECRLRQQELVREEGE